MSSIPRRGRKLFVASVIVFAVVGFISYRQDHDLRPRGVHSRAKEALHSSVSDSHSAGSQASRRLHADGDGGVGHKHGKHKHPHHTLCFLFGGLIIGAIIQVAQENFLPVIPYTSLLFIMGIILAVHHHRIPVTWPAWDNSVDIWEGIDAHLILYAFLPALIFSEAMRLNITIARSILPQVMTLATAGVLIGTVLTGVFVKVVFDGFADYNFGWMGAMTFGSILAATDPVAVVALFNQLGVSKRLTLLIAGESMLNDGTAIVCFTIFFTIWHPDRSFECSAQNVMLTFLRFTGVATILGLITGGASVTVVGWCSRRLFETDSMMQVVLTICCAYFSFILAEDQQLPFRTSGILTVVVSGAVFAHFGTPRFVSRETMHTIWEAIEFVGNTTIFLLAGLLFGHRLLLRREASDLVRQDWLWCLALYGASMVIRLVMVVVLWPLLNGLGRAISWREVVVMSFSGLRGAVGLALAIMVDQMAEEHVKVEKKIGSLFLFHIGGMALLTLLINAPLCAPLLNVLGLAKASKIDELVTENLADMMDNMAKASQDGVAALVPKLAEPPPSDEESEQLLPGDQVGACRAMLMQAVLSEYWREIDNGQLDRLSRPARVLCMVTEEALDHAETELEDWNAAVPYLGADASPGISYLMNKVPPFKWTDLKELFPDAERIHKYTIETALAFISAHEEALERFEEHSSKLPTLSDDAREAVKKECEKQCKEAQKYLDEKPKADVKAAHAKMVAGRLHAQQIEAIKTFGEEGLLTNSGMKNLHEAYHLQHKGWAEVAKGYKELKD